MDKERRYITSHVIPALTGGTHWNFPQTLRDVYAFRVRLFTANVSFLTYGTIIHIVCPELLDGYRAGSYLNPPQLIYSIAQIASTTQQPGNMPMPKHFTMRDVNIHSLYFRFVNQLGVDITFASPTSAQFIIDFWHHNKHQS